jgi:hypothetical protein
MTSAVGGVVKQYWRKFAPWILAAVTAVRWARSLKCR